ncbi:MAG: Mce-associated rane protein [Frankiales bacterium]|nr:Mce-associated rane protein [Frankiales bacterium]
MTDDVKPGTSDQPDDTRRPSPSAAAASRARRIGGRPLPGPSVTEAAEVTEAASAKVDVAKRPRRPNVATRLRRSSRPSGAEPRRPAREPRSRGRWLAQLGWLPAVVAGLAVLAMLAVAAWQSHGVWWAKTAQDTRERTQQEVLAAAKTCAAAILSYDYRNLDAAEAAGKACTTGQLKSDYTKAMETTVKQLAPQSKTVQTLQIAKAGIESVSPDGKQWVVLVYGQQAVTDAKTKSGDAPRLDLSNPEVTLDLVGGKWLVSNLGNPG